MLELFVRASEQLSGVVQNLTLVGTSVLRTTADGVTFVWVPTRNPAWVCIDLLTGPANPRPLPDALIDWPAWIALAAWCDQPVTRRINGALVTRARHTCDFVVTSATTAGELLDSILSCCRAARKISADGRYSVLLDQDKTLPRQLITPENSWGFSGARTFTRALHGLRVSFLDGEPTAGAGLGLWEPQEVIVYADGYDETNAEAEHIENLSTLGIVEYGSAFAFARYMMAQAILRGEQFTVSMDVEHLVAERGDLVHVAHDVPAVGGFPVRVVSLAGTTVEVSAPFSVPPTGYTVRQVDGVVRSGAVTAVPDGTHVTLDSVAGIQSGDLIVLGHVTRVTQPYLIQSIIPAADLSAELVMVKYDPAVYTADVAPLPEWHPGFGDDLINAGNLAAEALTLNSTVVYENREPVTVLALTWQVNGFGLDHCEVWTSTDGAKAVLEQTTRGLSATIRINTVREPWRVGSITIGVVPVGVTGIRGDGDVVVAVVDADTRAPRAVRDWSLEIQDQTIHMTWAEPEEEFDIDRYELRYHADVDGTWDGAQSLAVLPWSVTELSVPARIGRYFIRAVDTTGNRGEVRDARTTVLTLPGVNQLLVRESYPGFGGTRVAVDRVSDGAGAFFIRSALAPDGSVEPVGYYTYLNTVDLGDVQEARLSWKGRVRGERIALPFDDTLDIVPQAARGVRAAGASDPVAGEDWLVTLEYRAADDNQITMSDWIPLNNPNAAPIGGPGGGGVIWTDWRPVATVTDVTTRMIQFRLRLDSFARDVRAVVERSRVEIDAMDRLVMMQDLAIDPAGTAVVYDPGFIKRPVLVASIDGGGTATRVRITSRTKAGCTLTLFDAAGVAVAGSVDLVAQGIGKVRTTTI
jgi:hypothetical protein